MTVLYSLLFADLFIYIPLTDRISNALPKIVLYSLAQCVRLCDLMPVHLLLLFSVRTTTTSHVLNLVHVDSRAAGIPPPACANLWVDIVY